MNHLVIAPLLVPLLAGVILLLIRDTALTQRRLVSAVAALISIGLAIALLIEVSEGTVLVYRLGNWQAPFGIVLVADHLAAIMLLVTAILAASVVLYAVRGGDQSGRYFHLLFQLQLFGLNGAFLTGDLFNLFVFFEVLLIASYGLLLHGGGPKRTRAGLHYVVLNLIGSTLFLFAVGTLYGVLGTLNMADLTQNLATLDDDNVGIVRAAGLLLFVVFALKAALAPLHLWLPGAYSYTSLPVAAMFAIMTKVGAYAILRVYTLMFGAGNGPTADLLEPWLLPLALLTVAAGTVGLLASQRLAQQAAYLVVVSAGTLLTAFGLGGTAAVSAGLYYLAHTTFATAALFMLADILSRLRGAVSDRLVAGPALPHGQLFPALFLVIILAVTGIPPLSGFVGKFLILHSAADSLWMSWVFSVLLITSLLGIVAMARSGSQIFFDVDSEAKPAAALRTADLTGLLILVSTGIALVVFADPVYNFSAQAAAQLMEPSGYLNAVLHPGVTEFER